MTASIFRLTDSASLPEAIRAAAKPGAWDRAWVRAVGRLSEASLRAQDGRAQTLAGSVLLVSLEGTVEGPLMALVSHEDPLGARIVAGELISAVVADGVDVCITHASDAASSGEALPAPALTRGPAPSEPSFARAIEASAERPPAPAKPAAPLGLVQAMPQRPAKPPAVDEVETVCPDSGDRVEHFAFGTCEVIRSDGDRLHLRLDKNGTIKEIALEMLKVTELPGDGSAARRFKLERRVG